MGDDDHGHALVRKLLHDIQNLADHLGVESGGGLVKQHDIGLHAQRTDDGDTLLLAAGQLDGVSVGTVGKADTLKKLHRLGLRLLLGHMLDLNGSKDHVLDDGLVREKVKVLEHHAHLLAVLVYIYLLIGYIRALENDSAARGLLKKVKRAQKR